MHTLFYVSLIIIGILVISAVCFFLSLVFFYMAKAKLKKQSNDTNLAKIVRRRQILLNLAGLILCDSLVFASELFIIKGGMIFLIPAIVFVVALCIVVINKESIYKKSIGVLQIVANSLIIVVPLVATYIATIAWIVDSMFYWYI